MLPLPTIAQPILLGGSWVVISGVLSMATIIITHIRGLTTPVITTHEPPSGAGPSSRFSARRASRV